MTKSFYFLLLALIFFCNLTYAQAIQTIAGCGIGDDSTATNAELYDPLAVVTDAMGNVYLCDGGNNRVRKVSNAGIITTIAGNGILGNTGDGGAAILADIGVYSNSGIGLDKGGNICFSSTFFNCIRKVNITTGIISTIAGNDSAGYSGTGGPATAAKIGNAMGIAFDKTGNMYIAEELNYCIRKIDTFGNISLVAGSPPFGFGFGGDGGPATSAQLDPDGVAVDDAGNIYIADSYNECIRKVNTSGIISTIAGTGGTAGFSGDGGPAVSALLSFPTDVIVDSIGNIYVLDADNNRIRKIDVAGNISTYAGTGAYGFSGDGGPATNATFDGMASIWMGRSGNLYIADGANNRIRIVNALGIISSVAGENGSVTDGGPAISAEILAPGMSAIDNAGNIYITDIGNNRIKEISRTGTAIGNITTVAGNGIVGYGGDGGTAINAELDNPESVVFDTAGNMLIADAGNNRIRKVSTAGIITTIVGNGSGGFSGDGGLADTCELDQPWGIAFDQSGNLYIADYGNNRIRKVNAAGTISTVAGNGTYGYNGDGGLADTSELAPNDVAVDGAGNLIIADIGNNRIRKIDMATGIISTIAGTGTAGYNGDGISAVTAELNYPWSVRLDDAGNIYIVDLYNDRIRKINTAGIISTVAGKTGMGFSGDGGPADSALFIDLDGVCIDNSGNLFISDAGNDRIREVGYDLSAPKVNKTAPVIDLYPNPANSTVTVAITPFSQQRQGIIYNILGQEVERINIASSPQTIDISELTSGVYLLQVSNNTAAEKTIKRFVKE